MRVSLLVSWAVVLAGSSSIHARQQVLWEWTAPASDNDFGAALAGPTDVDLDGYADVLVGAPTFSNRTGAVYLYSGNSGQVLFSWQGEADQSEFGRDLDILSDLNRDGHPEVIIGAHLNDRVGLNAGAAFIYSGADGVLLHELLGEAAGNKFGRGVSHAGDVNQDGYGDFLVGADGFDGPLGPDQGKAYFYSGKTAWPLLTFLGEDNSHRFGHAVSDIGDVDADGFDDFVVAAPWGRKVYIYSGPLGNLVHRITGGQSRYGVSLARGSDHDNDGVPDLLIGSPDENLVDIRSGSTEEQIRSIIWGNSFFGNSVADSIDLDQNGFPDLLVGEPNRGPNSRGHAHIFSGKTFSHLPELEGNQENGGHVGFAVTAGGDVNGDGQPDFVIGAPGEPTTVGRVWVYTQSFGAPTVNSIDVVRQGYNDPAAATLTGQFFSTGQDPEVLFGAYPAVDVTVVDDTTITCMTPVAQPGPVDIVVQNDLGQTSLLDAFRFTPAIDPIYGNLTPGGVFVADYLCDPGDTLWGIWGVGPCQSIPTPPFDGTLGLLPLRTMFMIQGWPFIQFTLDENIPNDPALSGAQVYFQALVGPSLSGPNKDGAWTNCAVLTIQ